MEETALLALPFLAAVLPESGVGESVFSKCPEALP